MNTKHWFSLDVLRGVAAILVLCRHMPGRADDTALLTWDPIFVLSRIGWCGVDLFFVLSGFLISNILLSELVSTGTISLRRFFIKRTFKIWPCYFFGYGGLVLANIMVASIQRDWAQVRQYVATILPNCLFVQNYMSAAVRWDNSWSIAVEEHFYLSLPLVLTIICVWGRTRQLQLQGLSWLLPLAWFVGLGALSLRITSLMLGVSPSFLYYATHFRCDSLMAGVFLGYLWNCDRNLLGKLGACWPVWGTVLVLAIALIAYFPLGSSALTPTIGFTMLYAGFVGLVAAAIETPDAGKHGPWSCVGRMMAFVGRMSYGIYIAHSIVYHMPGVSRIRALLFSSSFRLFEDDTSVWADRGLFFMLSILGGVLLTLLVERPFLRLRDQVLARVGASNVPVGAAAHSVDNGLRENSPTVLSQFPVDEQSNAFLNQSVESDSNTLEHKVCS